MSLKIVFAFVCAVALCCGQTAATVSSGAPPAATRASTAAAPAAANSIQTNADSVAHKTAATAAPEADSTPKPAEPEKAPGEKTVATTAGKPYVIGPLDVLVITVWNQPNLSRAFDVGPDGMMSMPLIGQVKADGLTQTQLEDVLVKRLKEFLNTPEVNVQIGAVHSKRYFVYGEVGHSGEFPLIQETTIMDALSNIGGFRDFANLKKIYVMRGTQKFNFNYNDVSKGKHLEENIVLENMDRIFVP
ncbi:MAG TPA: polysaccharide biosynthesis/export family protein [Bryobacteraceae bacterium]|nr:polysaccharide biosynthesis/export family protein [Bryobacteraceae bacterium]